VDTTVDATDRDETTAAPDTSTDRLLYSAWKSDPSMFARDYGTRHSLRRSNLKQQTGWTDEAIEGYVSPLFKIFISA
jgi:activating signal cointegrator complex subunit 2